MAQKTVVINGVTYANCPEVDIPVSGGGTAKFVETSDADAVAGEILAGKKAYVNGSLVTGNIQSKSAETITPGTSDRVLAAATYLAGAQTIKGDANLQAGNILSGKTIFGVAGELTLPVISQDATTKVLSIA